MKSTARATAEPAPASEAPEVIHLPDRRQHGRKKITSGSNNRKRRHLEQFRTDDAEHEALHTLLRESGQSLGAFVMRLAGIEGGKTSRARLTRRRVAADEAAILRALVDFSRFNNNANQLAYTGNLMMLFAEEHGAARVAETGRDLVRAVEAQRADLAPVLAAFHAALAHEREG
jgi:hypothetical protein